MTRPLPLLNAVAVTAVVDFLLLIPLVYASRWFADEEGMVSVLGPIHGILFVALVGLCGFGARQAYWGWWFPLITVITGGAIGSLIGDKIVRRRLRAGPAT